MKPSLKLELRDELRVLYSRWTERDNLIYQLVLPEGFRERALQGGHDEVGYFGFERALIFIRLYWPRMANSIEEKCKKIACCLRRKAVLLKNISATYPLEPGCMDYLLPESESQDTSTLVPWMRKTNTIGGILSNLWSTRLIARQMTQQATHLMNLCLGGSPDCQLIQFWEFASKQQPSQSISRTSVNTYKKVTPWLPETQRNRERETK